MTPEQGAQASAQTLTTRRLQIGAYSFLRAQFEHLGHGGFEGAAAVIIKRLVRDLDGVEASADLVHDPEFLEGFGFAGAMSRDINVNHWLGVVGGSLDAKTTAEIIAELRVAGLSPNPIERKTRL